MKNFLMSFFCLTFVVILAQNVFSLVKADSQDPQINLPLNFPPQTDVFHKIFAKLNQARFTDEVICSLGICIRTPPPRIPLLKDLVVPTECRLPKPADYCVRIAVFNLSYDVNKYLLEPESLLPGKAFQGKSVKIKSTITLILKGIEPSILKELSSGVVKVSKVMTIKGDLHSLYIFLTLKK